LGDAVSTAARIESKCKEYGCLLLVGGATVERCKDDFFFLKIDDLAVKGKTVGIPLYTVLDDVKKHYESSRKRHIGMHSLYRQKRFIEAIEECKKLRGQFEGKMDLYYDMWIERCEYMQTQTLPDNWDGIFIATTK
jgi:adenylate cyclase